MVEIVESPEAGRIRAVYTVRFERAQPDSDAPVDHHRDPGTGLTPRRANPDPASRRRPLGSEDVVRGNVDLAIHHTALDAAVGHPEAEAAWCDSKRPQSRYLRGSRRAGKENSLAGFMDDK